MYSFANYLFSPFTLGCIAVTAAIGWLWLRHRKTAKRSLGTLTCAWAVFVATCTPLAGYLLSFPLERDFPPGRRRDASIQALVVLGGYVYPPDDSGNPPELGGDSLRRCAHAANLYFEGPPCWVIASGGHTDPENQGPSIAQAMRRELVRRGIPESRIITEEQSATTFENAVHTVNLLKSRRIRRFMVVTDAMHMKRAIACFRKLKTEPTPAACGHTAGVMEWSPDCFLPSVDGAQWVERASHEWLGMAWYKLHDRL